MTTNGTGHVHMLWHDDPADLQPARPFRNGLGVLRP